MSRPKSFISRLCHHKGTNQAIVYLSGKQHYLGLYSSLDAGRRYGELVAKLHQSGVEAVIASLRPQGN